MPRIKIQKNNEVHYFKTKKTGNPQHKILLDNGEFIELTTNKNYTSFPNFKVNGLYFLRDIYGNATGKIYKLPPWKAYWTSAVTMSFSIPIGQFTKYKISLNGKFRNKCVYDWHNSSTNSIISNAGSIINITNSKYETEWHTGGRNDTDPYPEQTLNVNEIDMSDFPLSMNGELNLTGNISELTSLNRELYSKNWYSSSGSNDGRFDRFKVYARKDSNNLIVTFGLYPNTSDRFRHLCTGIFSYGGTVYAD